MAKLKLFLFFIPILLSGQLNDAFAQDAIIFTDSNSSISITDGVSIYIDETQTATLKQVVDSYNKGLFRYKVGDVHSYSQSAIWVVFTLANNRTEKIFVELSPAFLNQVSFYKLKDENVVDSVISGSVYAMSNKPINSKNFVYPVNPGENLYFIRIQTNTYLPFKINIHSKKTFYEREHYWNIINGVLFGALILTFLYNLLLYITIRDSVYLYYLIFIFISAVTLAYYFGIGNEYIWGEYPIISRYITTLFGFFIIGAIIFVIRFFELSQVLAGFNKVLQFFIALNVVIIIFDLMGFHYLANYSLMIIGGIVYLLIFIIALYLLKKGNKSARLFSVSWVFAIIAFFIFITQNLHIFSSSNSSFEILIYGSYINIIMLSLVVGNKLNIYSENKQNARKKELIALRERDNVINAQKVKLESIVKDKNKEIIHKNEVLLSNQQEIENQTAEIEQKNQDINRINQQLRIKNEKIEAQNVNLRENKLELEKIVESRTIEMEKEKERAVVADNLKTSFLNNLSREIKTPMNAITGYATLILNKTISIPDRNEYLQIIIQNVDTLLSLIENIVTLSRIQAGINKVRTREIDLKAFVKTTADEFVEKLKDSNNTQVKLIAKVPKTPDDVFVKSDQNKLWLIFKHLIENAIRFTDKGVVEIGFNVIEAKQNELIMEPELQKKNSAQIEFFVKDPGSGMSKQDIEKYISSGIANINKYQYKQEGLGLAIITGLVEVFDGKINVVSEMGKGTDFYFEITTELVKTTT